MDIDNAHMSDATSMTATRRMDTDTAPTSYAPTITKPRLRLALDTSAPVNTPNDSHVHNPPKRLQLTSLADSIELDASYEVTNDTFTTAGYEISQSGINRAPVPRVPMKKELPPPSHHHDRTASCHVISSDYTRQTPIGNGNTNLTTMAQLLSYTTTLPQMEMKSATSTSMASIEEDDLSAINPRDLHELGSIGKGSCGIVRRALHIPTCRLVALKTVNIFDKEKRHQLVKELTTLSTLNSPNIIGFYGAYYQQGNTTLVLEYMNRNSLLSLVKSHGPLPDIMLRHVTAHMLRGLECLHTRHHLHRDIKPGNVLLNGKGDCKLADFGVVSALSNSEEMASTYVGTTMFMSPERVGNSQYSAPSDIWSVGITVYNLAVGRVPYDSTGGYWSIVQSIREGPSPEFPADTSERSYHPQLRHFLSCCLHKEPSQRWTAKKLLQHPYLQNIDTLWSQYMSSVNNNIYAYSTQPPPPQQQQEVMIELQQIITVLLDKYYTGVPYRRSLFDVARFQKIADEIGVEMSIVQQMFEQAYQTRGNK